MDNPALTAARNVVAALEEIEKVCQDLEALEEIDPCKGTYRNASAGGVAGLIREAIARAAGS